MQPSERVSAFLVDYEAAHTTIFEKYGEDTDDFEAMFTDWQMLVADVATRHGAAGFELPGNSLSSEPEHGPATRITDERSTDDGHAVVSAEREAYPRFVEYLLDEGDDGWRIVGIDEYPEPPDSPAIAPELANELLTAGSADAELLPLDDGDREDPATIFVEQVFTDDDGDTGEVLVHTVGSFEHGELLAIGDFGYEIHMLRPLTARVPPGTARVEMATAFGRCAGIRVLFDDAPVASWAKAGTDEDVNFGVDAGNLSVLDAAALYGLTVRQKEQAWERFIADPSGAELVERDGTAFGVIAESGWGDGVYPAYWGLDDSGMPAQLVIDFGIVPGAPWAGGGEELDDDEDAGRERGDWDDDAPTRLGDLQGASSGTAELRPVDDEDRERLPHLFTLGKVDDGSGYVDDVSLVETGSFPTGGSLVVVDFLYDLERAVTLLRPMPSGDVWAEWIWSDQWGERPAALRLRFSDEEPVEWRLGLDEDMFTTTDGLVAILDLERARGLTQGDVVRERDLWQEGDDTVRIVTTSDGDAIGVLALAGIGAGDYPVYCGLDAAGNPAQLVMDFFLLGDDEEDDDAL